MMIREMMFNNHETDEQRERRIEKGLDTLADTGWSRFEEILIFNSLLKYGRTKEGIDDLISIHANLLTLHGFMAGFQYVVIAAGNFQNLTKRYEQALIALEVLGFFMSLTGTFVCLISIEFLKSITEEPETTQVEGILRYSYFFKASECFAFAAGILLVLATNILIYDTKLPDGFCFAFNVLTFLLCVVVCWMCVVMIIRKQRYADGRYLNRYRDYKRSVKKLSDHGGDVNKLSQKEISIILSVGYNIENIQSKGKDELVKILQDAIKEDPRKVVMPEDNTCSTVSESTQHLTWESAVREDSIRLAVGLGPDNEETSQVLQDPS
jgi:protein-S-isoprenylcysteine O-methyltransferase Ste14